MKSHAHRKLPYVSSHHWSVLHHPRLTGQLSSRVSESFPILPKDMMYLNQRPSTHKAFIQPLICPFPLNSKTVVRDKYFTAAYQQKLITPSWNLSYKTAYLFYEYSRQPVSSLISWSPQFTFDLHDPFYVKFNLQLHLNL